MDPVLAARLAAHGLHEREGRVLLGAGDVPRGSARDAYAARCERVPGDLVVVWGPRGAPRAVRPQDARLVTRALLPPDEEAARRALQTAVRAIDRPALQALHEVADAMRDAVAAGPLPRDDLHQALREALPAALLWPCRGCGTRHVHPSLWRAAGLRGEVQRVAVPGSQAAGYAALALPPGDDVRAGAELARRVLLLHGPATTAEVVAFLSTSTAHARALLEAAGAQPVRRDGRAAWAAPDPPEPREHRGVRLLPPGDPLLEGRDRGRVLPDPALRAKLVAVLSRTGAVLADGRVAGTWRARTKGGRVEVEVDAPGVARDALEAEASTLAAARGTVARLV